MNEPGPSTKTSVAPIAVDKGKGRTHPTNMEIELMTYPEAELAKYKSVQEHKTSQQQVSQQDLKKLCWQVSQHMDEVKKNLLATLDNSISIVSSLSSGNTGPSVSASDDDNFEEEEDEEYQEKRDRGQEVGRSDYRQADKA